MIWSKHVGADGKPLWTTGTGDNRCEIWRKFSTEFMLEIFVGGTLANTTRHSNLTAAKTYAAEQEVQRKAPTVREFAEEHRVSRSTVYRAAERMLITLSKGIPARVIRGELPVRMDEFERLLRDGPLLAHIADRIARLDVARRSGAKEVARQA